MSVYTAAIASGSNGNCYYVGNEEDAILVDAGISCRETEKRMKALSLSMKKVKAIFISHEHGDHIKGLEAIASKFSIPVYITASTLRQSRLRISPELIHSFAPYEEVSIGSLFITAFPKKHDAADPHSFVVTSEGYNVGIFTDIGTPCENVCRYFRSCDIAYLETNYDEAMLENGRYPFHLRRRIAGAYGHLSNTQALQLLLDHGNSHLRHVFLSHLSANNNCPKLVAQLFKNYIPEENFTVASRYAATNVVQLTSESLVKQTDSSTVQATLF